MSWVRPVVPASRRPGWLALAIASAAIISGCTVINPPQSTASQADLTRFRTWAMAIHKAMVVDFPNLKIDGPAPEEVMPWLDDQSGDVLVTVSDTLQREVGQELGLLTMPGFTMQVVSTDPRIVSVRLRGVPADNVAASLGHRLYLVGEAPLPTDPAASPGAVPTIVIYQIPDDGRLLTMVPDGDTLYLILAGFRDEMDDGVLERSASGVVSGPAASPIPTASPGVWGSP